jgi:pyrimidine operon attenuation protein/uracil phosphoribosyltransferase
MEILNHEQITNKIRRIAYQIAEVFMEYEQVVLAGIADGGFQFAELLKKDLEEIVSFEVILCKVSIDKKNPRQEISTSIKAAAYEDKGVVLCDDVLNSGTTLVYSVRHFLDVPLAKFKTAVLVNRNHKKYPVKADFKGISLSTTMEEHVHVDITSTRFSVTLE